MKLIVMMQKFISRHFVRLVDLLTFIVVWAIFFFEGRYMLFLQEQTQLFQNDWHYISGNLFRADGFSRMLTEWIVQFYHLPWLGVTLIALVTVAGIVALRKCISCVTDSRSAGEALSLASFIPLVYNVITCEDSFPMVSFVVAAVISSMVLRIRGRYSFIPVALVTPLLFMMCGPSSMILPLIYAAAMISRCPGISRFTAIVPILAYVISGFLMVRTGFVGAAHDLWLCTYPLYDAPGEDFNMFAMLPYYIAAAGAFALSALSLIRDGAFVRSGFLVGVLFLLGSGLSVWLAPGKTYAENIDYKIYSTWAKLHYLYTNGHYEDLLGIYEKKSPSNSVESNYVNLALYRTDRLAFDFFKYKPGWLHHSLRTTWIDMPFPFPYIWIETCNQMGALAKAQQAAFEGNILAGPRGSAPMTKYLAESEIIRGNYTAADKFLTALENTVFYREWAEEQRSFLNDMAVEDNSYYSLKRACYYEEPRTLFDMNDLWLMTEILKNNPLHYSSFEYTGVMTLAAGELQTFLNFILQMSEAGIVRVPLPPIFQDAMVMAFPNKPEIHKLYRIEPQRVKDYAEYSAAIKGKGNNNLNANTVISKNSTRVWHYLYLMSRNASKSQNPKK